MATQSSLVKKIEEDFLACAICFEQLRDPIGLPCLHGFCFECLDKWFKTSQDKSLVICPSCKEPAQVPKDGIRGFPGHFLVKNLRDTLDKENQDEKQVLCNTCGKTVTAHCLDCKKYLCNSCLACHQAFEGIKDHRVVTVEELQSGKVTHEGRYCKLHGGSLLWYYCETEQKQVCPDCISLKICDIEHVRIGLKDAAEKQAPLIKALIQQCNEAAARNVSVIQETHKVQEDVLKAKQEAMSTLDQAKKTYHIQIDQMIKKHEDEINQLVEERESKISNILDGLETTRRELQTASDKGTQITGSASEYEITHTYGFLSTTLKNPTLSQPAAADNSLGYIKFETATAVIPSIGQISKATEWKLIRQFIIASMGNNPRCIVVNNCNGDMAVSFKGKVCILSSNGQCKHTQCLNYDTSICVTPDNRYLTFTEKNIRHYDTNGKVQSTTPHGIKGNNPVCGSAVDSHGRIILAWENCVVSIHYAEGSLISHFSVSSEPYCIAVTSNGDIVASFDRSLVLMDYSGNNIRIIQAPTGFTSWDPGYVCCNPRNEIFVINEGGDGYIYKYRADGEYIGLVTTDVSVARGMALSEDCSELFVIEEESNLVKVFKHL